jgi:hypothetical protein
MLLALEVGNEFRLVDRTEDYSPGRTASIFLATEPTQFVIHAGISYVQNFYDTPIGAAAGISDFVTADGVVTILPEPRDWRAQVYGVLISHTRAFYVAHGEARLWTFFQVWE